MTSTFKHPYEDCIVGNKSTLYVPQRKKPFDLTCLYAVPFDADDVAKNAAARDQLQAEMQNHVARLRSRRAIRREAMAFYCRLLGGVPNCWVDWFDGWLRFFQSHYGMFKHREAVNLRRYQRGRKYAAIVSCNDRWFYGEYASKRELEQDIGPTK